jgi:hypothetical protein
MKENTDLTKFKGILCMWNRDLSIVRMALLSKFIHRSDQHKAYQNPSYLFSFFSFIRKLTSLF